MNRKDALSSGIPAGLNFITEQDIGLLPVNEVPYELENIILKWLFTLPEVHADRNSLTGIMYDDPKYGLCLTEVGRSSFVTWMLDALKKEQGQKNFVEEARNLFYRQDQLY